MRVKNSTKNTLYAEDIDLHIPYEDGAVMDIAPEQIKKSKSLRALLLGFMLDVVDYNPDEQVEAAVVYLRNKRMAELKSSAPSPTPPPAPQPPPPPPVRVAAPPPVTSPDPVRQVASPELITVQDEIEVKMHGLFYDDSGYAKVNRNLAMKLHQAGFKLKISPKKGRNDLGEEDLRKVAPLESVRLSRNHIQIDSIVPSFSELSTGKYKILYTTVESYTVPKLYLDCCENYDEIWLTSPWSAEILRKYINKPIYVVPAGVDETLYFENGPAFNLRPQTKDFVFMSVFSWGYRKGYDVLLRAYMDEFSAEDNVTLLIMSKYQGNTTRQHKNKIKEDIEAIMRDFPNKDLPHIARHNSLVAERDMPNMYRAAHCFVLPTRGEGSCLPPVEASLCGLPLIMTNCSGQQMYLRPDTAYLIEPDELVEIQRGQMHIHYWDGQKFPSLKSPRVHNQLRAAMRSVYTNYAEAKRRNQRMQEFILTNYTWTHTANAATARLKAIYEIMRARQ